MTSYTQARNPASEVGFELAKFLPEAVPLKDKLTPEFLMRLLQRHPGATLAEFHEELKLDYSLVASPSALSRAFSRAGLDGKARREWKRGILSGPFKDDEDRAPSFTKLDNVI